MAKKIELSDIFNFVNNNNKDMSKFKDRLESKVRIKELTDVINKSIEDYNKKNTDLTVGETNSVLLTMLTDFNNLLIKFE